LYRRFLETFLAKFDMRAFAFATGDEGLALTKNVCPDLIVIDWCLEVGLSARATIELLKKQEWTKDVPVVVISGERMNPEDDLQARRAGAALFVTKREISDEIETQSFLRRLKSLILERRQALVAAASNAGAQGGTALTPEQLPALEGHLRKFSAHSATSQALSQPMPERGHAGPREDGVLTCGRIRVDGKKRRVWVGKREIEHVGHKQLEILLLLLKNPEGVSRAKLHSSICDGENSRGVDMAVSRLRKVLGFKRHKGIISIPQGYKLVG